MRVLANVRTDKQEAKMGRNRLMPRRQPNDVVERYGTTFGKAIKALREKMGFSLRGACVELGISPAYLSDIEHDRRYPPVGDVLQKFLEVYKVDPETEYYLMDLIGIGRKQVAPDMEEFLRSNVMARMLVRKMMQVYNFDALSIDNEDESMEVEKALDNLISKGVIERPYDPSIEFDE